MTNHRFGSSFDVVSFYARRKRGVFKKWCHLCFEIATPFIV